MIGQRDASNLDIILRCDRDFHRQTDAVIAAPKLRHVRMELYILGFGQSSGRLVGSRPQIAALCVLNIDPGSPVLPRRVGAPTREVNVLPATISGAHARDQHPVTPIREKMNLGPRSLRGHAPRRDDNLPFDHAMLFDMDRLWLRSLKWNIVWDLLLKKQLDTLHERIRVEAAHHHVILQVVDERQQDHPLVMCHIRTHDSVRLPQREMGR